MIARPLLILLAPGLLAIAVSLGVLLFGSMHWQAPAPLRPDLSATATVAKQAPVAPDAYAEQAARPLLNPARRPEPRGQVEDNGIIGDFEILGLFGTAEESGGVILHNTRTRQSSRLRVGQSLSGWRLEAIKPRSAVFVSAQGQRELPLKRQAQPQNTVPASPAQPSAQPAAPAR